MLVNHLRNNSSDAIKYRSCHLEIIYNKNILYLKCLKFPKIPNCIYRFHKVNHLYLTII